MNDPTTFDAARRSFLLKLGAGLGWVSVAELLGTPAWAQQPAGRRACSAMGRSPRRTSRRRRSASSTCTCWAPFRRWTRSTTSRRWRRCTGRSSRLGPGHRAAVDDGGRPDVVSGRGAARQVPAGRQERSDDQRPDAVHARDRRRPLLHQDDEHRAVNHDPASKFLHTGFQIAGRPSGGAWVNYALGSDNQDLPTFVVMSSGNAAGVPIDAAAWGSGFLPSHYQGVLFRSGDDPVPYVGNPDGSDPEGSPRDARLIGDVVQGAERRVERSGDPVPRQPVRNVVPDADVGSRSGRHLEGTGPRARPLRPGRAQARHVRAQLPARPPAGRT